MKNIQRLFILIFVSVLCGCFSEWTGNEGAITISLGASPRSLGNRGDIPDFTYTVILNGPGGTVQERFTGKDAVMRVMPGKWNVTVKAYYSNSVDGYGHKEELRAIGFQTVNVKAGQNPTVTVDMISASEVESFEKLRDLAGNLSDVPEEEKEQEEIIIIKNNISMDSTSDDNIVLISSRITLIAEKEGITISTVSPGPDGDKYFSPGLFHINEQGYLTLGKEGMSGTIILDGRNITKGAEYKPLISVDAGGTLLMNDKVTLRNNNGTSAVENKGTFTMCGGTIRGNTATAGGGVYNTGMFTMEGGEIFGNTAVLSDDGNGGGGGVYLLDGTSAVFIKTGGTITGYASNTVTGNVVRDNSYNVFTRGGKGHAVYVSSDKRKETTAGPTVKLDSGNDAGWDE